MKYLKLKFLLMFFALAMAIPPAWAETVTATLTQSVLELTGSYSTNTQITVGGITYQHKDLMKNNQDIQAKASTGTIFNTTAYPGNITSVAITHSGTARATTISGSSDGTNWSQVATGSGSITGDFSGKGYKYFKITRGSNAAYWTKIEITYQSGTVLEQVATPTFSPAAGTYTEVQNVEINCETEGATIYYTTDGSTPTTTSTEYTGAITVNETMTLKAIAVKSGMDNSTVASATYTINLPVVPSGVIYKKVNSSNIKNGGTYVIIYEGDPAAAMGEIVTVPDNGTKGSSVTGIILDKTTTPHQVDLANKSALLLTARATNTEGRYAFEIGEGSYLKCKSASFDIADSYTNVTDAQWDVLGDGRVKSANTSSNRPIIYRAGNVNLFGPYASSNVNNTEYFYAYLYEKVDGSGVERVATPTFDPAGDAYDTPQSVTISCETPNSTIYYTTDGTDPTESSTLYNGAIEVNETMTIKAIAVADDMENSLVATATYTLPKFVANLTAANALPDNTNFKYTKDVVVVYRKNGQMWIQDKDGTEGGGFVYTSGLTFNQSDVINANWTAKKIKYSTNNTEYPEFTEFVGTASSTTQTPIAIERSALSTDNIHEYVLLKNVTISDDLNVTLGSRAQYQLYTDKLEEYTNFTPETGKTYDVKGLVGIYQNNLQIYPLEITEYVAPGEPSITITPPNVLPFNDEGGIYTVDGSNLPTDGLGVNVSNGFSRELLEGGNNEYYYFPTYNGAVDGRQTKVTYNGRELSATGTITYESGSANKSADLSYRADVYIIGNFSNAGWNYGDGSRPMTYNEGTKTYTYTLEDVPANSYIMFARKTDETYDWNTYPTYNGGNRLFFGAKTDNDGASWWYVSDATDDLVFEPSTVGQTKYSPIYFENAGTYTITINAANKTFTINKVVHQVATPVFDPEGGEYNTIQMVAITCETEGAVIHYTTDGTAPDANSPVYRDAITVDQSMTIKAIAVMDGMDNSEVAEATYTLPTSVKTVVAANALEKNTEFLFTGDAVVTYHNGDYTFLRDVNATAGGGLIYQSGFNLAQGVVLKKGWDAKRDDYRGEKEYINAINVESSGNTADFTPFDRTGVAFDDTHMNEYVTFNNVTITSKTLDEGSGKYTFTGTYTDGNRANVDYILHNQFDLTNIEVNKTYNVTGLVVKRDDNMQVYPTEVVEAPQVATPTITPNGGVFTAAQEVTIATTTEGAKLYYSLDGENWIEGSTLTVDHSGTVYAKATKAGMNDSEVAEATFTINYAPITITLEPASGEYTVGDEAKVKVTIANTVGTATVTYMTGETAETANTPVTPDEDGYITIPTTEAGTVVLKVTASDAYHAEPVIKTGTYTIEAKPYVTAVPASLDFVTVIGEEPVSKTFTVMAENLKGDITLTMTESNVFTITPATIAKADMTEEGVVVTVTYNPTAVTGDNFDEAMITIKSTDAEDVTVTLTGMATLPDPVLTVSTETLEMGTKPSDTFTVTGQHLTENVTVSIKEGSDPGFSVDPTSITPTEGAVNAATVTVTYSGTSTTDAYATVVVKSGTASKEVIVSAHVLPTPVILIDDETLDLGTSGEGTFDLTAENLRGNITLTSDNPNFTVEPATITPEEAEDIVTVTVTYNGDNTEGETAHITITTEGLDEPVTITVTAKAETYVDIAKPTFSPAAGTYTEPKQVAIACATPGVTIKYSINGGTPQDYTKPFMVSESCTVTAMATMGSKVVYNDSEATAQYTINKVDAANIVDNYYYLQNNAEEVAGKYANVAGRRTLNFVPDTVQKAGTVFRIETGEGGAVKTLRSQAVDLQGYANRAMAYVPKVIELVLSTLANSSLGDPETPGTGILGENGLDLILKKFYDNFDYNLYVEGSEGAYRIYGRTPSMQHVVDFYHENTAQVEEKLPKLETYINQVLEKIKGKIPAPYDANVVIPFSLKAVRDRIAEKNGITLIDPTVDEMGFYRQVLNNKEYVWDFAYQTAMMYVDVIKQTGTYQSLDPEYKRFVDKMQNIRPETKYYMIQYGNEPDYVSENNVKIIGNDPSTFWTLTPRVNFTVNVPEANKLNDSYYTTLYTDFAYELPTGVNAYAVTGIDANKVAELTEITGTIPAQTPVLLKADAAGDKVLTIKKESRGGAIEGNLLEGPDYLINKYQFEAPTVANLFTMAASIVPADILADYEYLKLRNSGTVNNKYFWNVNSDLENITGINVLRSLSTSTGVLAFSDDSMTEDNKAFMVSETPNSVIYLSIDTVATPTLSLVPGSYTGNQTLEIECDTQGATISYSTDGGNNWTEGTSVTLTEDCTVMVKAEKEGMIPSKVVTAEYIIDEATEQPDVPAMKGYYQIMNNENEMYANVAGRRTLNFKSEAEAESNAGTIFYLETNDKGQVQSLRSQGVDLQGYANRAMHYVPDMVQLVVNTLHAEGAGSDYILGENGLDEIMEKFNECFDYHLYVEPVGDSWRIYGKTPSMQHVVDFYREHTAQVEAKLPMLEEFINDALTKLRNKIGGSTVFTDFSLHQIWEKMGGTLTEPVDDASTMAFYREVLNNKNYVWDFAYQTAQIYWNNVKDHPRYNELKAQLGEYADYIDEFVNQVRPDFKYYIIQRGNEPDYISQGNAEINDPRSLWTLEPRETFKLNSAGELFGCPLAPQGIGGYFTTNYTDFAYTLPEGVTAYKVTAVDNDGEATLEALEGIIPAQTPVLLVAEEDGAYTVTLTTEPATADTTGNMLVGPDYLIKLYQFKTPMVVDLFTFAQGILGEDLYNTYVAPYEYLQLRYSGTVNNKYFWNVNSDLGNITGVSVVRSLSTETGNLAFSDNAKTETNKAFLVSDTFDVITLPSLVRGDVNHDGLVNIIDVSCLIDRLLGKPDPEHIVACPYCSDVNRNHSVNIIDVTALIDILLGGSVTDTTEPEEGDGE